MNQKRRAVRPTPRNQAAMGSKDAATDRAMAAFLSARTSGAVESMLASYSSLAGETYRDHVLAKAFRALQEQFGPNPFASHPHVSRTAFDAHLLILLDWVLALEKRPGAESEGREMEVSRVIDAALRFGLTGLDGTTAW